MPVVEFYPWKLLFKCHIWHFMIIQDTNSDKAVLKELGRRIKTVRLAKNVTRKDLAIQAGIAMRTLVRLETGEAEVRLSMLIRTCRALGCLDRINILFPEHQISPIQIMQMQGKIRRRASRPRSQKEEGGWTWKEK